MRIMVTGASGQLGWDCVREAGRRGHEVIGAGREDLDITDSDMTFDRIRSIRPAAIIHCAAWTNVDDAEDQPEICRRINVDGTRNVAEAAKYVGAKLLYISTDYVFDGSGTEPWTEEDEPSPLNTYGQSKLDGENVVREETETHFIVRTSWLYGVHGKNFVQTMLRIGGERDSVRVVNDQFGTPTYSADLASLLVDLAETNQFGTYHAINTDGYLSWYDFTKEIYRLAGLPTKVVPVSSEKYGARANRPHNSRLDTGKLVREGFKPLPAWDDALIRYLTEMKKHGTD